LRVEVQGHFDVAACVICTVSLPDPMAVLQWRLVVYAAVVLARVEDGAPSPVVGVGDISLFGTA
jgi:hypothetical protein